MSIRTYKVTCVAVLRSISSADKGGCMYDPDYIAVEIARCEILIDHLQHKIEELHHSTVFNEEGEVTSYADWAA